MIIGKDKLGEVFDLIHNVWIKTRTTVIILAAADCDSICTTKILTSLLATEMITYQIQPVLSYEHIAEYNDKTLQQKIRDNELHTIIMINCGAIVDLNQYLFIRPLENQYRILKQQQRNNNNDGDDDIDFDHDMENEDADDHKLAEYIGDCLNQIDDILTKFKIYVIDSHRPFNLFNVYDDNNVVLLQGQDEHIEYPGLIGSVVEDDDDAQYMNNNDDDDDDDDFNMEGDDDIKEPPQKRRRLNQNNSSNSISEKQRESIRLQREQDDYYKYQYYALNSSNILYLIARSVQKDDNDMLWNAILGLTESFIYEKIDRDKYNESVSVYCDEVKRRNDTYNNVSTMDAEAHYNMDSANIDNSQIVTHRNMDHIQFSTEFRFCLMRFWTLYESMYYSRYVATKMAIWKQRGKENLKFLLAKMALPLNEAQQPFSSMKRDYKKKLPQMFADNLEYGLDENLTFGSFTKQHGGHQSISASDMAYAITAVLESDFKVRSNDNNNTNKAQEDDNNNNDGEKDGENNNLCLFFDDNAWKSNFFYGYDSLSKDKQYLLKEAIALAKERQTEIVNMGIRLIEQRDIASHGIVRYCKIQNANKFQSPMLLCKLALFVMDAFRAQTTKNAKHFVLASYNDKSNSYTVVGIPAKKYIGDVNKSPFYTSFEEARQRVNATAKIVFFEGHVIQIHKDHFDDWFENLHERLLSYAF